MLSTFSHTRLKATAEPQINKLTIVIVGDGAVGKSSLTLQFIKKEFFDSYDPTIDDSYVITITVDGAPWQIEVLDTAGQEEYRDLWVEHAVTQGEAFIVTYAINSNRSFRAVPDFLKLIANRKSGKRGHRSTSSDLRSKDFPFPFVIVGNKKDLIDQRSVGTSEGAQIANATGGLFYECSAKTGANVDEIFFQLIRSVVKLREGAAAHRKNETMNNRRFICNIGYQLAQQATHGRPSPLSVLQNQSCSSSQNVLSSESPEPLTGDLTLTTSIDGPDQAPNHFTACHDMDVTSATGKTTKSCCDCVVA